MARLLFSILLLLALTLPAFPTWGQAEDTESVPPDTKVFMKKPDLTYKQAKK